MKRLDEEARILSNRANTFEFMIHFNENEKIE